LGRGASGKSAAVGFVALAVLIAVLVVGGVWFGWIRRD
jgi:hypothetical protein